MTFRLTVLGSSSALPTKDRYPTAHVLNVHERFFLVDCGEGTQMQLKRMGGLIKLSKLNNIFISHLHGDHIFGLFGLLSTLDLMGRKAVLNIYGPSLLENILNDHLKYFGEHMGYKINMLIHDTRKNAIIYEDHCMTVETIPLKHRVPTCGFLFKEKMPTMNIHKQAIEKYNLSLEEIARIKEGNDYNKEGVFVKNQDLTYIPYTPRSYAFCSDTAYKESIIPIIKGVDLLYHEATFMEDLHAQAEQTMHSTSKQAATIAQMAEVKELLIGHFSSRYDDRAVLEFETEARNIFANTNAVEEGKSYDIELVKFKQ